MTVNTIYHTSNDAFLIEQELLFQTRPRSRRPSEENYLFEMRPGSIKELFVQEAFREGGWWQLVDESQIIKSCGAYRFKTSLIIGARYYCFKKTEKYRYAFINFLLPKLIKKAEELGCESVVMTFNKYNDSFPRGKNGE